MIVESYNSIDGIKVFHDDIDANHSDYNSNRLNNLYTQEEKHFWFISRKELILQEVEKVIPKNSKIIEIGAGTGNVSRYLEGNGYRDISVGEMHYAGLRYAQEYGINNCFQFDLLRSPFENEFDTVGMFDVLEHIDDDCFALKNVSRMLRNNGVVVLTVPAHMWLWTRSDAVAGQT